jgi:hypothetical protein
MGKRRSRYVACARARVNPAAEEADPCRVQATLVTRPRSPFGVRAMLTLLTVLGPFLWLRRRVN